MSARLPHMYIQTPEGIRFTLLLAGPVSRSLAWCVDAFCIVVGTQLVGIAVSLTGLISHDLAVALNIAALFLVSVGYGMATEWLWKGQTIGKRLLRLRVMDSRGLRLRFSQVAIRNLLRVVDSLPVAYLIGGATCMLTAKSQRLGDLAAGTIVVRHLKPVQPDLDQIAEDRYNSMRDYPHLAARLRQRVAPAVADLALQALLRRQRLQPRQRVELFGELAAYFRNLVPFPQQATEGLSDERYVRNVVALLFQSQLNRPRRTGP